MKKTRIHIIMAFLLGAMVFIGCQEKRDYPPLVLGNSTAPVVTLANIADSINETYTYLELSSNMDGSIYYVVLAQGSEAPTANDIILGNTDPAGASIAAVADDEYSIKVKNLSSGASYDLYAVAANADEGKPGEVVGPVSFTCLDLTPPFISEMVPANGETWVSRTISEIVLTMNEEVTLVDADKIQIVDAFDESDLGVKGEVTVAGSTVTIEITDTIPYLTDVAILIEKGAFKDAVDSLSVEEYIDGGSYALMFSIEDIINIDNFIGAYQCHELDYAYGGEYFYDVVLIQSDDYSVDIVNIFNYGVYATLVFDPVGDSCYIPDQSSGLSSGGDPLNFTSEDLIPGICTFVPGSYTTDGITIKVSCWLYSPALGDLYFASDLELTKYLTPGAKAIPQANPDRVAKGLRAFRRF